MSFIAVIRDYLDVFSSNSSSNLEICVKTVTFFSEAFVSFVHYVLTFGWIGDIIYLPVTLPFLQDSILSGKFFPGDINFMSETMKSESFWSVFSVGFLNSFFCCLPLSTSHFLSLRRLFVQGLAAGVTSTLGGIMGQCLFLGCTLFGFRLFVIPWFSLDPINYLISFVLLFVVIYEMSNEKRIRPINVSEKSVLTNIFLLSFFLSWTEQSCFLQYLKNVSLGSEPTVFEGFSNFNYLLGLILGHIFFSFVFVFLSLNLKKAFFSISKLPYSLWLKKMNFVFLSVTLGLSLTSLPYYSFDYLLAAPLGFISQDKSFSKSIFAQNELEDPNRLLTSLDGFFPLTLDTDISYFDRGDYGGQQGFFKKNFEELNYQGEYAWSSRRDKKPNLYTAAQTTKTTILDFFQGNLDKNQEDSSGNLQPIVRVGQSKLSDSSKKSYGNDRQKLKTRFETNYEENQSEGFVLGSSFNTFPLFNDTLVPSLEKSIKKKFYSNPVYKTLLHSEIDSYLTRSPDAFLSGKEESELFSKRKFLSDYYDSIRAYQKVPYQDDFQEFFQGSKSYVDRAYHHQFKGNLRVVSQYFDLSLNQDALERELFSQGEQEESVLKYDQPLFFTNDLTEHEELNIPLVLDPFLEPSESFPFYFGYDPNSGQVITTRFGTDSKMSRGPSADWQGWPLSKKVLSELEEKGDCSFVTLFHSTLNPDMKDVLFLSISIDPSENVSMDSSSDPLASNLKSFKRNAPLEYLTLGKNLPAHLKYLDKDSSNSLIPNYGGVIWPGNQLSN